MYPFEERENNTDNLAPKIKSPSCKIHCGLKTIAFKENSNSEKNTFDCVACYKKEVVEGVLACDCGNLFPIMSCVPRLLDGNLDAFPDFVNEYKDKLLSLVSASDKHNKFTALIKDFKKIHDSFSEEWNFFEYDRDKTWGWSTDDRKEVFLSEIGYETNLLKDKLLLDAGCGNGILTSILSDFDIEVVGLDISESVERADANKGKFSENSTNFVHFVQGNLFNPPFKNGAFDIIYSSGVLHHCPDTKETFLKIMPLVKRSGRAYVWVYGKRGLLVSAFMWHGRILRRYMSLKSLFNYCKILSPFYKIATDTLSALKIYNFRKRTTREISLDLFDAFSPQYNHTHTSIEVSAWFADANFSNIHVAGISKHGFGVRGDKNK